MNKVNKLFNLFIIVLALIHINACQFNLGRTLHETISLNKSDANLFFGETLQLEARISNQRSASSADTVTWASSNENVATVTAKGLVKAVSVGEAEITASLPNGSVSKTIVNVSVMASVNESKISLANFLSSKVTEEIKNSEEGYVWSCSDESIATVNRDGVVSVIKDGDVVIKLTNSVGEVILEFPLSVVVPVEEVVIEDYKALMQVGDTYKIVISVLPETATDKGYIFTSSNSKILEVNDEGLVTAISPGIVKVTVQSRNNNIKNEISITVQTKVQTVKVQSFGISPDSVDLVPGAKKPLVVEFKPVNATNKNVIWTVSDPSSVSVEKNTIIVSENAPIDTVVRVVGTTEDGNLKSVCNVNIIENKEPILGSHIKFASSKSFTISTKDNSSHWNNNIQYSTDGISWTDWSGLSINSGRNDDEYFLLFRGIKNSVVTGSNLDASWVIDATDDVRCTGDIRNLLNWENLNGVSAEPYCFYGLFRGNKKLINTPELKLDKLSSNCYAYMFAECTNLYEVSEFVCRSLNVSCFEGMFSGCESLTNSPKLPFIRLQDYCYKDMFKNSGIKVSPSLPSTELAKGCYESMFNGCKSLESIPELPANILAESCYKDMFKGSVLSFSRQRSDGYINPLVIGGKNANEALKGMFDGNSLSLFSEDPFPGNTYFTPAKIVPAGENIKYVDLTSIVISPSTKTIKPGESVSLNVTYYPDNATCRRLVWKTSDDSVAKVVDGVITAENKGGNCVITAVADDGGFTSTCNVTIDFIPLKSISFEKAEYFYDPNTNFNLNIKFNPENATNKNVIWTSSNTGNVLINSSNGNATAIKANSFSDITVRSLENSDITATCRINVNAIKVTDVLISPSTLQMNKDDIKKLTIIVNPTNATNKNYTISVDDEDCLQLMDNSGTIKALKSGGKCKVTVKTEDGNFSASCDINISSIPVESVRLDKSEVKLDKDATFQLTATVLPSNATNKNIVWSSSDKTIATVDENGLVTAKKASSSCYIFAKSEDGDKEAACRVEVNGIAVTGIQKSKGSYDAILLNSGAKTQLSAEVIPSNATDKTITWHSSNPLEVSVDSNGLVTALEPGAYATIVATAKDGGYTVSWNVSVQSASVKSISFGNSSYSVNINTPQKLSVIFNPVNATNKNLTYKSNNSDIAVTSDGRVVGYKKGSIATITATSEDGGHTAICQVKINNTDAIAVDPLTFSSRSEFSIQADKNWNGKIYYSTDKNNWTEWEGDAINSAANENNWQYIYFRGENNTVITGENGEHWSITSGGGVNVSGDLRSLLDYKNVEEVTMDDYCFRNFLAINPNLVDSNLEMNFMKLSKGCFEKMYYRCENLILHRSVKLPALIMEENCYCSMFAFSAIDDYSNLSDTFDLTLDSVDLAKGCYKGMFSSTGLINSPKLPATILAESCYESMFEGCRSLSKISSLPAKILKESCYKKMYKNSNVMFSNYTVSIYKYAFRIGSTNAQDATYEMIYLTSGLYYADPKPDMMVYTNIPVIDGETVNVIIVGR